eukprot:scaffold1034_cov127-Cylindrotheca_fusiformis.AAC.21
MGYQNDDILRGTALRSQCLLGKTLINDPRKQAMHRAVCERNIYEPMGVSRANSVGGDCKSFVFDGRSHSPKKGETIT